MIIWNNIILWSDEIYWYVERCTVCLNCVLKVAPTDESHFEENVNADGSQFFTDSRRHGLVHKLADWNAVFPTLQQNSDADERKVRKREANLREVGKVCMEKQQVLRFDAQIQLAIHQRAKLDDTVTNTQPFQISKEKF